MLSASLQTTILAENQRDGGISYVPITFDLLWTGEGETNHNGVRVERVSVPGLSHIQRSSGRSRTAVLSGSITFGSRDLADSETVYADLLGHYDAFSTIVFTQKN